MVARSETFINGVILAGDEPSAAEKEKRRRESQ